MYNYCSIEEIDGAYLFCNFSAEDIRGNFLKVLQKSKMPEDISSIEFVECFITASRKNVLRGMHFQRPPDAVEKLVTVVSGEALDVILDLRVNSPTYKKFFSVKLGGTSKYQTIFVPSGCAHGFLALTDEMRMLYQTSCEYSPVNDSGIHYNSFGFHWPVSADQLILSDKDAALPEWTEKEIIFS